MTAQRAKKPGLHITLSCHKTFAKATVTFEIPFAAHGGAACRKTFGVKQNPNPPTCGTGSCTRVVLAQTPLKIERPSNIGAEASFAVTAQYINKAFPTVFGIGFLLILHRSSMERTLALCNHEVGGVSGKHLSVLWSQALRQHRMKASLTRILAS